MRTRPYNVLFLCTHNSARSIMAESILRKDGAQTFRAFSAGSMPSGVVNLAALKVLNSFGYPTDNLLSKSWEIFTAPNAPYMDFVFTVCDAAAGETCPLWPGQPITAHWGIGIRRQSKAATSKKSAPSSPRSGICGTEFPSSRACLSPP